MPTTSRSTERVSGRLKLRSLRIVSAVAKWGSMAKAADHLAISQPVVSKAIADLEHTLGVRLFDRSAQGVEPTMYGRALVKCGVAVFDELRQGVRQLEFLADPTAGELRIGSSEGMAVGFLSAVIERLYRQYPRVVLHVTQTDTSTLQYGELRERNVELVLGRLTTATGDDDLDTEVLFDDQLYVVAGLESRWARRRLIKLADLVHEPWVLPPSDSKIGPLTAELFRASGLEVPHASVITFSIHLRNSLLATGRFLTLLPGSMLRFGAKRLSFKVLPVELPAQPSPVGIVTLKNRTLSPVAQLFVDCARATAKPIAKVR